MFKVGDVLAIEAPNGEIGLSYVEGFSQLSCKLIRLSYSNPNDPHYTYIVGTSYHISLTVDITNNIEVLGNLLDHTSIDSKGSNKCHCSKEVWMYQGCKCGGV